ncbi:MAG TPA: outer membrane beta-barrel protein [Bacteroidales bacterium]|nr:outer membrane beta-barrel protein [Bacteroidales bacterium]
MKKCSIILLFCLVTGYSWGQTFSLHAGENWTWMKEVNGNTRLGYSKPFTGYNFSIGLEFLNNRLFSIGTSLGYITKSGNETVNFTAPLYNPHTEIYKTDLSFITASAVLNLKFPLGRILRPYLFAGPRIDYLVTDKISSSFGLNSKYASGASTGGGVELKFLKLSVGAGVEYRFDFNHYSRAGSVPAVTGFVPASDMKERTLIASVSVKFRF